MYGWCKLLEEDENKMIVGYSWQQNETCDGRLIFDKKTKEVEVAKMSEGATKGWTAYLVGPIRGRIRRGMEIGRRYGVATG